MKLIYFKSILSYHTIETFFFLGKLKSTSDIDEDFLDSVEKQYFKETTTDIAHDPQSEIIQPSLCPSDTYIKPLHPTSSEPPSQISPPQTQTLSIKTTSFSCIDKTKQEIHDEIPYVHNSQATSNSVSGQLILFTKIILLILSNTLVLQDDNYSLKDCGTLASHVINSLSLMRKGTCTCTYIVRVLILPLYKLCFSFHQT